jgi:hypothetical protein
MDFLKAKKNYLARDKDKHQRKVGVYYSSDLGSILNGWMKPEDFWKEKEFTEEATNKILTGIFLEEGLKEILKESKAKCEYQKRYEVELTEGIRVVVKTDFEFPDVVWETKWSAKTMNECLKNYEYQLEAQYRATGKAIYLVKFKIPFDIEESLFIPSEERWEKIKREMAKFHKKLLANEKKNETTKT